MTTGVTTEGPTEGDKGRWVALGARLRSAREAKGMSLRELARRLGCSPSHISQAERGRTALSVSMLYDAVAELGLSMDRLFDSADSVGLGDSGGAAGPAGSVEGSVDDVRVAGGPAAGDGGAPPASAPPTTAGEARFVQRAGARRAIEVETGMRWELLTPYPERGVDFREIVYDVGAGSAPGERFIRHSGREYGLVLEGELRVRIAFEEFALGPGDSIAFDSTSPHRFWNAGDRRARAVWFSVADPAADI
ncbi:XRE family transcriptional regulator [Streptomyces sp. NBC_00841]|uniref:helix-turn-helix domain-containing protein n=1 Tax=Streptomyces sp. NBC_00841 TaxID=2975847 RepID=UPI002DDBE77D|nr:XRE family transcriptional regulator [Streptomyces sp. NBC_00841]WRZ97142.1 XRE family transcriptional regulator [Streptomyces sp. NBC_00841]